MCFQKTHGEKKNAWQQTEAKNSPLFHTNLSSSKTSNTSALNRTTKADELKWTIYSEM